MDTLKINTLRRFVRDESGATVMEYAVITGIITLASFAAIIGVGVKFLMMFSQVSG